MKRAIVLGGTIAGLLLGACSEDNGSEEHFDLRDPGRLVAWVQKHHRVDKVTFDGNQLVLERKTNSSNSMIFDAGDRAYKILNGLQSASHKDDLHSIRLTYSAELADKYNNSVGVKPVLEITFDVPECMKYNMAKSSAFDMLECAKVQVLHRVADAAPRQYCDDEGDRRFSPTFCNRFAP